MNKQQFLKGLGVAVSVGALGGAAKVAGLFEKENRCEDFSTEKAKVQADCFYHTGLSDECESLFFEDKKPNGYCDVDFEGVPSYGDPVIRIKQQKDGTYDVSISTTVNHVVERYEFDANGKVIDYSTSRAMTEHTPELSTFNATATEEELQAIVTKLTAEVHAYLTSGKYEADVDRIFAKYSESETEKFNKSARPERNFQINYKRYVTPTLADRLFRP